MTHSRGLGGGLPEKVRFRIFGVAFMVVVVMFLALVVAFYNKAFTPVVNVKVDTDRAGLNLLQRSDVKVRGLIVGEVRGVHTNGTGAQLDLAIDPGKAKLIPANAQARLLPKTLFGEKYVDLEIPAQPTGRLRDGTVIQQDKSQAAVEIDKVLDDVLPVLKAVQPEKLNATLNALATALQGRGDQLGQTLDQADYLLKQVNPKLGTLMYDIRALADVSDIYNDAAPDLLRTLRNLNVTSQTVVDEKTTIEQLIPTTTAVSDKANRFVSDNTNKIIGVNIASLDALKLAATYSPELPCVFQGLMRLKPRIESAIGGRNPMLNLTVEIVKPRPPYKYPTDKVKVQDQRGPNCYGLPNNPKVPFPGMVELDGTQDDVWWNTSGNSTTTQSTTANRGRALSGILVQPSSQATELSTIKSVIAPLIKVPSNQVSDAAELVFGPVVKGGTVTLR